MKFFSRFGGRGVRWSFAVAVIAITAATIATGCRKSGPDTGLLPGTHTLALPDGTQLSSAAPKSVQYRDMSVRLEVVGIDVQGDPVLQATGNHREVKSTESVAVSPDLTAWLAHVERSGPAAAGNDAVTSEYWLIVVGPDPSRTDMRLAYSIIATVTGNADRAKEELLESVSGWTLPGKK